MKEVKPTGLYHLERIARGEYTPETIKELVNAIDLSGKNTMYLTSRGSIRSREGGLEGLESLLEGHLGSSSVIDASNKLIQCAVGLTNIEGICPTNSSTVWMSADNWIIRDGNLGTKTSLGNQVSYEGYKTVSVPEIKKEVIKVLQSVDESGQPVYVESEMETTVEVPKRVPVTKNKWVWKDIEVIKAEIQDNVVKFLTEFKAKLLDSLLELHNSKPLSDFTRPIVEYEQFEEISKWNESTNSKQLSLTPESLQLFGFNTDLLLDETKKFVWGDLSLDGFIPMYPSRLAENSRSIKILGDVELYVCQFSGKLLFRDELAAIHLYTYASKVFGLRHIISKLDKHSFPVRISTTGGKMFNTRVLVQDKRIWSNLSISSRDYDTAVGTTNSKRIREFLEGGSDYIIISGSSPSGYVKFLEFLGIDSIDIKAGGSWVASLTKEGCSVSTGSRLPKLEKVLPIPTSAMDGVETRSLHFPTKPDQGLGFWRDDNPVPSVEPKPGYRYYGMEIELENAERDVTPDIVSGLIAPRIIEAGFTYGTDGSLRSGLEFRSCPQGFQTMSKNLSELFSILKTPYDLSYSIYGNLRRTKTKQSGWEIVNGRWEFVTPKDDNGDKVRLTKPNSWTALETCGLHIHVSRDSLTELQLAKMMTFVYSKSNNQFMTRIAGRTSDRYAEMTSHPPFTINSNGRIALTKSGSIAVGRTTKTFSDPETGKVLKQFTVPRIHKASGGDHSFKYTAMSTRYDHTVEFRIFKGVDNAKDAITKLQFVDSLVEFTSCNSRMPVSLSDCMSKTKYLSWLMDDPSNRKKYNLLIEFILSFENDDKYRSVKDTITRRTEERKEIMKIFK